MKAKLQEYALVAEIIGAIAIVASLIFVGVQVNQESEQTRAAIRQSMLETDVNILFYGADRPQASFNEIFDEGTQDYNIQTMYLTAYARTRETYWIQYTNGLLDETTYQSYMRSFIAFLADFPAAYSLWIKMTATRAPLEPQFIQIVNKMVDEYQN